MKCTVKRTVLPVLLLLAAACGPRYGLRVPDELVKKLPYESRIELLESENDLALAIGYLELLTHDLDFSPTLQAAAQHVAMFLDGATNNVRRFQRLQRMAVHETPFGPSLDLEGASADVPKS